MKALTGTMKIVLNIFLVIAISLLIFASLATSTVLSENYILSRLDDTNYYQGIKELVYSNFENYIMQSGFDDNVVANIVSDEKIKEDTQIIVSNIYEGKHEDIDTTEIEQNLRNNINNTLKDQNLNTTQQKAVDKYVETIIKQYKSTILKTEYEDNINNVITKLSKFAKIAKIASAISIIVILVIIIIVNKKLTKTVKQFGISLTSSGMLYVIVNAYINAKIKIDNIIFLNESISAIIKKFSNDILSNFVNFGTAFIVLGIVLILLVNKIEVKKQEERVKDENY